MRYGILLFAIVATAQQPDPRGFVNQRLLRQNVFAKNLLIAPKLKPLPPRKPVLLKPKPKFRLLAGKPQDTACAIPLLEAQVKDKNADPKMAIPPSGNTGDVKMIRPTIPVCPQK